MELEYSLGREGREGERMKGEGRKRIGRKGVMEERWREGREGREGKGRHEEW